LIRDRAYGAAFIRRVRAIGISRPTGLGAVALAERRSARSDGPALRKEARFAENAKHWHHRPFRHAPRW
jgi:hypothetical protein